MNFKNLFAIQPKQNKKRAKLNKKKMKKILNNKNNNFVSEKFIKLLSMFVYILEIS